MNEQSQKEKEEIFKIQAERDALKIRTYFDIVKTITLVIGSIILFWVVQRPESILNQQTSKESISRERAKLILDLIKEDDPQKLALGLSVIEASYPSTEEEWFLKLKQTFELQSNIKIVNDLSDRYEKLSVKREMTMEELNVEISGGNGQAGAGPRYRMLKTEIDRIEYEMEQIMEMLKAYGIDHN